MDYKKYEKLVAELYYAVKTAEDLTTNLKTLRFERNKKIRNSYGVDREFDIYWEYQLDGVVHNAAIECKNYNSTIPIEKMDALVGKLGDVKKDITPIFATKTGYQSGAVAAAEHHNIELLIVRRDISEWTDENGNRMALVRHITIEVTLFPPAQIHTFTPIIDGDWVREHTTINPSESTSIQGLTNEIFIDDRVNQERYSLQDLSARLQPQNFSYGRFQEKKEFTDAYIEAPNNGSLKMLSFSVDYSLDQPLSETVEIESDNILVGVIEYLQRGEKKLVFKDKDNNYHIRTNR